jgi:exodeoxyribonuclease VII large subunit
VQGDGAKEEIADAIARVNRSSAKLGGIDVMIVGRGGGSLEDLWAFNEEHVARAIFNSEIPIVSAVGHEVDFTIADYVADLRAATPTAAAELVVPQLTDLIAGLDTQTHRLSRAALRAVESATSRLSMLERCEWFRDPLGRIGHRQQQLDEVTGRLRLAISRRLSACSAALHESEMRLAKVRPEVQLGRRRELLGEIEHRLRWAQGHFNLKLERRLAAVESRLRVSSPNRLVQQGAIVLGHLTDRLTRGQQTRLRDCQHGLDALEARILAASSEAVLRRGYTITRSADGRLIRSPADTDAGEQIVTQTAGGEIRSRVESSDDES